MQGRRRVIDKAELLSRARPLLVAYDAGGAEILAALLVAHPQWHASLVLDGPARAIFARKLGPVQPATLEEAMDRADWVLTGTGWQSRLEYEAIRLAKHRGRPVVAFLDHWVNYRQRFERDGVTCLPDRIWVGDRDALRLAVPLFPEIPVELHANPYFEEVRASFHSYAESEPGQQGNFLFVSEPIADHAQRTFGDPRFMGYTEHDALAYFLRVAPRLTRDIQQIVIRPHPSEPRDKYDDLLRHCDLPVRLGGAQDLRREILSAAAVFGCNSMAMVVALLAGKIVYCCIPPGGPPCTLPQREIRLLREIPPL